MSNESSKQLDNLRHSLAHLLAKAVLELYPGVHNAIGPSIENGFYQDFDMGEVKITDTDLPKIEKKMRQILPSWKKFSFEEVTLEQAEKLFGHNPYKLELAREFAKGGKKLKTNNPGNFLDLCKMGHVEEPAKELKHFKLLSVAGAYWRGDEKNKMLTRIYGTGFFVREELEAYLKQREEAAKRDHRKLGQQLDLFTFSEHVGAGLPLFTPRGTIIMHAVRDYLNELKEAKGYQQVDIPHIGKQELYKTSGHWDKFEDGIFEVKGQGEEFILKPMNCPHHIQIYASSPRSYRDLPIAYAEITKQYRDEQRGELQGLSRVRSITIDDTHVFIRPDQIQEQARAAYDIITTFCKTFDLEYKIRLSVRDSKKKKSYLGSEANWQKAENELASLLKSVKEEYFIGEGESAFYAPKIDFIVRDSIGREWQLSTIQLDFVQPERFDIEYADDKGQKTRPAMIHIAVAGSLERFLSIMIEHYAGAFPTWLSPEQVRLIPVGSVHVKQCQKLKEEFANNDIRSAVDDANETVGNKIRKAVKLKVPYLLVIGDKEAKSTKLHIRRRGADTVIAKSKSAFMKHLVEEISRRKDQDL
ncbi:MAG: threonine--tRNA ligase [bacterium]|nr:threonine--tRNA ligase [bacterium]